MSASWGGLVVRLAWAWCAVFVSSAPPALGAPSASHGPLQALESAPARIELAVGRGRAASTGDGWLVVYSDTVGAVVGLQIDPGGTPLGDSFAIAPDAQVTSSLSVARLGDGFVVSWVERAYPFYRLKVQRLDALGNLIGTAVLLDQESEPLYATSSAGDTSTLVVSCHEAAPEGCDTWLLGDTEPVAGETLPLDFLPEGVAAGYSDGMWLIAIQRSALDLSLARLDGDGSLLDEAPVRLGPANVLKQYPSVAPRADGFVVSWLEYTDVRFSTVSFDGDITTLPEPALPAMASATRAVLAATPSGFALVATSANSSCTSCPEQVRLRRFTPELSPTPAETLIVEAEASVGYTFPFLAVDDNALLVVWNGPSEVLRSKRIPMAESEAPPSDSTTLSYALSTQWNPQGAPGPGGWLAVWSEGVPGGPANIRAALLSPDGAPKAEPFVASVGSYDAQRRLVDVSGSAAGWLIAWHEGAVLRTRFIGPQGELSADVPEHAYSMLSDIRARLARSQGGWLLAWDRQTSSGEPFVVVGTRFDDAGNRLETALLSEGSAYPHDLDLMGTPDGYRVWWKEREGTIRSRTISSAGVASNAVLESPFATPPSRELFATAWGKSSWFGWRHDLGPSQGSDLLFTSTPNGVAPQVLSQTLGSRLVAIGGLAATIVYQNGQTPRVALAAPGGPLVDADLVQSDWGGLLSQPVDDQLLVTVSRNDVVYGHPTLRAYAYLEQLSGLPGDNMGGEGGAGGPTGAGGATDTAGAGGAPVVGSAGGGDGGAPLGVAGTPDEGGAPHNAAGTAGTRAGAGGRAMGGTPNGGSTAGEPPGGEAAGGAPAERTDAAGDSGCACASAPPPEWRLAAWLASLSLLVVARQRRRGRISRE